MSIKTDVIFKVAFKTQMETHQKDTVYEENIREKEQIKKVIFKGTHRCLKYK